MQATHIPFEGLMDEKYNTREILALDKASLFKNYQSFFIYCNTIYCSELGSLLLFTIIADIFQSHKDTSYSFFLLINPNKT